jgi:PAS domain S-box-containing protein
VFEGLKGILWEYSKMMNRYEHIFENSPIGILEEDWSAVKTIFESMRKSVTQSEFPLHLASHPELLEKIIDSIKLIRVNKKAQQMFEIDESIDPLSIPVKTVYTPDSMGEMIRGFSELYSGGKEFKIDLTAITPKGNKFNFIHYIKLSEDDPECKNVIVSIVDVTIDRQQSKKLQNNVRKYQQLLDSTNTVYIISDEEGEIRDVSKNLMTFFGTDCQISCLIGKHLRAFVSSESILAFDSAWKRMIKGQTVNAVEIALTKKDAFKWVSLNASLFDNGGSKVFILLTDITERKRADYENLIAREKSRDKIMNNIRNMRNAIERIGNK